MKTIPQISEAELEVMKILWKLGQATSSEIVDRLSQTTDWKPKTIQTLITRLVQKGALRAEKTDARAFTYFPFVDEQNYKSYANKNFLEKMYNGSLNLMLTSFIKEKKLSRQEVDELKKLLDEEE